MLSTKNNQAFIDVKWRHEHPNSLDDLDLTFFNLTNSDKQRKSWDDLSDKSDISPSFCIANGSNKILLVYLDYQQRSSRLMKNEDRFYLRLIPRTDDGSTDNYRFQSGEGGERLLYEGSNFDALISVIKDNQVKVK
jgi:hypothetical protein